MGVLDDLGKLVDLGKRAVAGELEAPEPEEREVNRSPGANFYTGATDPVPLLHFTCPCGHARTFDLTVDEPQNAVASTRLHLEQCRAARRRLQGK